LKHVTEDNFDQKIADSDVQKKLLAGKKLTYVTRNISIKERPEIFDDGWYILKELKTKIKLAKDKSRQEVFEDEVWAILSKLGFNYMSVGRDCRIRYDVKEGSAQQIDVLAVDEETAVVVECKCAESDVPVKAQFKTQIEALEGKKPGLIRELRKLFGKPKLKVAFVLATKNYLVSKPDLERLQSFGIRHFASSDVGYYQDLVDHLGTASRFQFLADLFPGQSIPELDSRVYAIQGNMGGLTYYSFSIEPMKLLKLSYVLHRSKSIKLLPSYQRLIKKPRLNAIRRFVDGGNFFPNSIVVNIDTNGKKLDFSAAPEKINGTKTKLGVLHLPAKYRSVYVIDGQHRLYGYAESAYAEVNSLPVVAFVDLERVDQLKLFMEINENQKAVSKNLKHTLDADLKWDSKNLRDRAEGIKKQLAQEMGEDVSSPLYERVLVGEDQRTDIKVISLDAILKGLNRTNFFGKFTKDQIREPGLLNTGLSGKTLTLLKELVFTYFDFVAENNASEWQRKQVGGAILTVNDGVTALLMLLSDLINHLVQTGVITPLKTSPADMAVNAYSFFKPIERFFENLSEAERNELRKKYGSGAPTRLWRIFQREIHSEHEEFCPDGLEEYWVNESKMFNIETFQHIQEIEMFLKDEVKQILFKEFGNMWLKSGVPRELYAHLVTEAAKKNIIIENEEDEKSPWDCLNLIHYRDVIANRKHWSNLFQNRFTAPGSESLKKEVKTQWLVKLNTIRNVCDHEYSVSKEQSDFVGAVHDWLILDNAELIQSFTAEGIDED
jgi:DNA sulfur modification protein DndB